MSCCCPTGKLNLFLFVILTKNRLNIITFHFFADGPRTLTRMTSSLNTLPGNRTLKLIW